jgi:hypothetical protein
MGDTAGESDLIRTGANEASSQLPDAVETIIPLGQGSTTSQRPLTQIVPHSFEDWLGEGGYSGVVEIGIAASDGKQITD